MQLGFSVIKSRCQDTLKNLVDPRLGLPAENEICATCGGTNYDECTGETRRLGLEWGFLVVAFSIIVVHCVTW